MFDHEFKARGFLVWGICALFFLYEFFLRTVIGTYQHPVMHDLNLTSFQFSLLSTTLFLVIYGFMQIPAGLIVENVGLKKALILGAICCSLSSLGFAYANTYALAMGYRVIMGIGASFGFICLLMSVHDWMPHRYSAIFIGLSQFIGTLGPMIAAGPLHSLSESMGIHWRTIFLYLASFGILLVLLAFLFVENNQQKTGKYIILHKPEKISVSVARLFSKLQPWYIAILSASLYFTIEYLSENEGRTFLALKGISLHSASYMITISWIGYAVGCPFLGFLSDLLHRRKSIMQAAAFLGLLAILMILYAQSQSLLQIAFFLLGLSASSQTIGFALIAEQFKKQFIAVGFGLNNAMITGLAGINAPLIGLMIDALQQGSTASLGTYLVVFNLFPFISILAILLSSFFIKETYCKSAVDFTIVSPAANTK